MEDFEQGLNSILMDSMEILEVDVSFDASDTITYSVCAGFLHVVITISDSSKPRLASSIDSYKLWW